MTRLCDIDAANEYKPDYVGFVFAQSRRRVTIQQAVKMREKLSQGIIPVGVFVNETMDNIIEIVQNGIIDIIQLHGKENGDYILKLKALTGKPVIKAVQPKENAESADYLLFDSITPGSGKSFNWDLIGEVKKPYFLAGGLNAENVAKAVKKLSPFAVDVSSGVETDGCKDPEKIKEFIRRVCYEC